MERPDIESRIKNTAANTDKLISRLDTLTGRIGAATANDNRELVEYYERQFAEASVEFLDGVETILDDWYALRGETRPPAREEYISPEDIENIHNAVVSIVQGRPVEEPRASSPRPEAADCSGKHDQRDYEAPAHPGEHAPRHKVDIKG